MMRMEIRNLRNNIMGSKSLSRMKLTLSVSGFKNILSDLMGYQKVLSAIPRYFQEGFDLLPD